MYVVQAPVPKFVVDLGGVFSPVHQFLVAIN